MNLDDFKNINESLGLLHANQILNEIGKRLSDALDGRNCIYRESLMMNFLLYLMRPKRKLES